MVIKINYTSSDIYVSTNVSPVYVVVNYSAVNNGAGGAIWGGITGTLSDQTDLQNALNAKVPYSGATAAVNLGAYDLTVNELTIGKGLNGVANNTALGKRTLFHNTTGNYNTAVGHEAGHNITTGQYNTAIGQSAMFTATTAGQNTAVGVNALLLATSGGSNVAVGLDTLQHITTGSSNTAIGYNAGSHITGGSTPNTTATNSVFIGRDSKAAADGQTNQIVIGQNAVGNGSNTATFGNTATTANYFTGSVNGGSFVKSGGTSSQFLKADGSVDSSSYVGGSGATGQVAYWNGTSSQTGSNNLFWDAANARLGIGTNTPAYGLHNVGTSAFDNGNSGDAVTILNSGFLRWTSVRFRGFASSFDFQDNAFSTKVSLSMSGSLSAFNTGGNYSFGGSTDGGQRLQVYGDAFIKGSGATSATTALTVQNSGSNSIFKTRNDGKVIFGSELDIYAPFIQPSIGGGVLNINGSHLMFGTANTDNSNAGPSGFWFEANFSAASGGQSKLLNLAGVFTGATAAEHTNLRLGYTINQAVGANGITRGLYVNPTLTAAADWRSIEWSNNSGWGLYGAGTCNNYLAGRLSIGTLDQSQGLRIGRNPTAADTTTNFVNVAIQNSVTTAYRGFATSIGLNASGFTLPNLSHFEAIQDGAFTAGVVTNHYGFRVNALVSGTNIYGFHSNITSGTDRWNLYMLGADNYLAGKLLIGTTTVSTFALDVNGTARVSGAMTVTGNFTNTSGVTITKNINMETDGTTAGRIEYAVSGGNLINIGRFASSSGTGTARPFYVLYRTPDYGVNSQRVMTMFTDNGIMFRDEVAAAYGNPTQTTSAFIEMVSTTRGFLPPRMTTTEKGNIASPVAGLMVFDTTLVKLCVYNGTTWETITSI